MTEKHVQTRTIGGRKGATCGELLALLNEYVDGNVDAPICRKLEKHLAQCRPCRVVVDNIRKTITLYRNDKPCALPAGFRSRLYTTLRQCWKTSGPSRKKPKSPR
jgi:anti-sigma factor RsiW